MPAVSIVQLCVTNESNIRWNLFLFEIIVCYHHLRNDTEQFKWTDQICTLSH